MSAESSVLSIVSRNPLMLNQVQKAGITDEHFAEPYDKAFRWVLKMKREHGQVPTPEMLEHRFDIELRRTPRRSLAIAVSQLHDQKKYRDFGDALDDAARKATGPEVLDEVLSDLQGNLNRLTLQKDRQGVVDVFSAKVNKRMVKDYKKRRRGESMGIPTGLKRFDSICGGLQKQRMIVVMGRPGLGKSWLDLLFVVEAVLAGHKCMLFPLEMTLEETMYRLYTMFSNRTWGEDKALKNLDLIRGRITIGKIVKLQRILEDRFEGQLHIADIGSITDPYTVERVDAEVQTHKPDLFWIDLITLMKGPTSRDGAEDHTTIKALSNGVKGIAQRNNAVGGVSAQVNREAMKRVAFLPRLENIAYGDAIGQDADQVISINRKSSGYSEYLYYAVVKNRHGPEIGKTRVRFFVDSGTITETEDQEGDDDDD